MKTEADYIVYWLGMSYQAEQRYADTAKPHWRKAWCYAIRQCERGLEMLEVK